jgi:uncharacterized protein (DUF433 family)
MGVIVKNTEILSGTPVLRRTRVPIQTLFDYLEGGETLEDFREGFLTVSREFEVAALGAIQVLPRIFEKNSCSHRGARRTELRGNTSEGANLDAASSAVARSGRCAIRCRRRFLP